MNLDKLKEDANEEIARRHARLMPLNWDPEPEEVLALIEVAEKARAYQTAREDHRSGASATQERLEAWDAFCSALSRLEESKPNG